MEKLTLPTFPVKVLSTNNPDIPPTIQKEIQSLLIFAPRGSQKGLLKSSVTLAETTPNLYCWLPTVGVELGDYFFIGGE